MITAQTLHRYRAATRAFQYDPSRQREIDLIDSHVEAHEQIARLTKERDDYRARLLQARGQGMTNSNNLRTALEHILRQRIYAVQELRGAENRPDRDVTVAAYDALVNEILAAMHDNIGSLRTPVHLRSAVGGLLKKMRDEATALRAVAEEDARIVRREVPDWDDSRYNDSITGKRARADMLITQAARFQRLLEKQIGAIPVDAS